MGLDKTLLRKLEKYILPVNEHMRRISRMSQFKGKAPCADKRQLDIGVQIQAWSNRSAGGNSRRSSILEVDHLNLTPVIIPAQAVRARYQRYGLLERTSARDPAVLRGAQRARQHGVRSADGEGARQVGRLALEPRCEACCAA